MIAGFINLDGLVWALAGLGLLFLVLLILAIVALFMLGRRGWRRWTGAAILMALLAYGIVPTTVANMRGDRLGAQLAAASFWPDEVRFADTNVLIVGRVGRSCGPLCETLFERGDVTAIYLVGLSPDLLAGPVTAEALGDGATRVQRVVHETSALGSTWVSTDAALLPDSADWFIVRDDQGVHARALSDEIDLPERTAADIAVALHIYAVEGGRLDPMLQVTAVARMLTGWRVERPYFLPLAASTRFANSTTPFSDALETWICGTITQDWDTRCPYLF